MRRPLAAALALLAPATASCGGETPVPLPLRVTVEGRGLAGELATAIPVGAGRVVTVAHVLEGARRVAIAGRRARVLRRDPGLDLAVLAVPGLRARAVRLGDDGRSGHVVVLRGGRPRVVAVRERRRAIATVRRRDGTGSDRRPVISLDAGVAPGDSGAPVTDGGGRVVGVVFARSTRRPGTAYAVAAAAVRAVLRAG